MTVTPQPTPAASTEPTPAASTEPSPAASTEPTPVASTEPTAPDSMQRVADSLDVLNGQVEVLVVAVGILVLFLVFLAVLAVRR